MLLFCAGINLIVIVILNRCIGSIYSLRREQVGQFHSLDDDRRWWSSRRAAAIPSNIPIYRQVHYQYYIYLCTYILYGIIFMICISFIFYRRMRVCAWTDDRRTTTIVLRTCCEKKVSFLRLCESSVWAAKLYWSVARPTDRPSDPPLSSSHMWVTAQVAVTAATWLAALASTTAARRWPAEWGRDRFRKLYAANSLVELAWMSLHIKCLWMYTERWTPLGIKVLLHAEIIATYTHSQWIDEWEKGTTQSQRKSLLISWL